MDDTFRLLQADLFDTQYTDARSAASLIGRGLSTYSASRNDRRWTTNPLLRRASETSGRLNLVCAALFDLVCNVEYVHGRLVNDRWIYCNRHREDAHAQPFAYYSFLKQCPRCCQDRGLESRLAGAQHKPSSHHIGEITTTAAAFFLSLLGKSAARPLEVGVVSKQSHNIDALAWRDDLLVLFEVKASPLVTYPLRTRLQSPRLTTKEDRPTEVAQHSLIEVDLNERPLSLYLANRDYDVPLGAPSGPSWPYPEVRAFVSTSNGLMTYLESWLEIFFAYSIPKTERDGRDEVLAYLANGWGDEIDSNKTKAGLGRTDDIKKGTYQLLKFGAYYRDGSPQLPIRGALVANLDPLFMYEEYMARLIDGRWAPARKFSPTRSTPTRLTINESDLYYIYDCLLAFNRPVVNDPLLRDCFSFALMEAAIERGDLDTTLREWSADP